MEHFFEQSNLALTDSKPKIVAAIPTYNEAAYIARIVMSTKKYVDEVIVIDDGSIDGTDKIAEESGAIVVRHEVNMGKGTAVNTAFQIARKVKPLAMVLLDGDGQHDPGAIHLLLKPIYQKQADMVVGSRFLINNHVPKYRVLGQTVLNLCTNLGSGVKLTDSQSGFRAFSTRAIECLSFAEKGFAVESEMQFRAAEHGLKIVEVPIITSYNGKTKRSPVIHGFSVLFRVLKLTWDKYFNSNHKQKPVLTMQNVHLLPKNAQVSEAKNR
ncbi:MAG: glycosyltransferase family 2 protein [Bacillota bacterium]